MTQHRPPCRLPTCQPTTPHHPAPLSFPFICSDATRTYWFNPASLVLGGELEVEYALVGALLGLAIYNGEPAGVPPLPCRVVGVLGDAACVGGAWFSSSVVLLSAAANPVAKEVEAVGECPALWLVGPWLLMVCWLGCRRHFGCALPSGDLQEAAGPQADLRSEHMRRMGSAAAGYAAGCYMMRCLVALCSMSITGSGFGSIRTNHFICTSCP